MTGPDKNADALVARAEAGDPQAQYLLAAQLNAAGQTENARRWLERAASAGHPDAMFTSSAARLAGAAGVEPDPEAAIAGLRRAKSLGVVSATRLLAALHAQGFGVKRSWRQGCEFLREAIALGDPFAKREAAMLFFMTDPDDRDGAVLIEQAARRDELAAATAARRAILGRTGASSRTAREAIATLTRSGHPLAADFEWQMRAANPSPRADEVLSHRLLSDAALLEKLVALENPAARRGEQLSESPRVEVIRRAFTPEECDYLIGSAAPKLSRTLIVDGNTDESRIDPYRTAWGASFLPGSIDVPIVRMRERLAGLAHSPTAHAEPLNILRYLPGEEYLPHHDFLSEIEEDLARRGQRVRTALIYLNDGFEGGETHFLSPDMKVRGAPGDVVVFDNVDGSGAPDVSARHAGLPVTRGVKWLASLWIRDRAYEP